MILPAFSYLYTKQNFPARGIVAWAALDGRTWKRSQVVIHLARFFNISKVNARILINRGNGIFWRATSRKVRPYPQKRLWKTVAGESIVPQEEYVSLPSEALNSISIMRAYLAQPTLTRGPSKPISLAASAAKLGRGERVITTYRKSLARAGRLKTIPQYERLRKQKLILTAPPLVHGEFIKKGYVYRRIADIVIIKNGLDEAVIWPTIKVKKPRARRYFQSAKTLKEWQTKRGNIAPNAIIKIEDDWIRITNGLNGVVGETLYSNIKGIHPARNVPLDGTRTRACKM